MCVHKTTQKEDFSLNFIYLIEMQRDEIPACGSLYKCSQGLEWGQAKANRQKLNVLLPHKQKEPAIGA